MPRKKVVRIQDVPTAPEEQQQQQAPPPPPAPAAEPKPAVDTPAATVVATEQQPPPPQPTPKQVEPTPPPPPPPQKKQRARRATVPPQMKSRTIRRTTQEMKKAQEIDYMVTRIANELRKDGWAAPPPPQPQQPIRQQQQQQPRPHPYRPRRGTKQMELREVLRRHNVPNNYRRTPGEYVQQYEEYDDDEELPTAATPAGPTTSPIEDYMEEEDDGYGEYYDDENLFQQEPKSTRFVPKTTDKVASVYSQIFGNY